MRAPLIGEFAGTFMMMLLGDGVVAACLLKGTKATGEGWLVITTAWAFAVLCGIFTANLFGSADAHLNPAITVAFGILNSDMSKVLPYACAQVGGSFAAAVVVWLFYFPHWKITQDPAAKLGIFCTAPAIRSYGSNLFSEIVGAFVLVIVAGAIGSKTRLERRCRGGIRALPGGLVGMGHRFVARSHHRLRNKPRTRLRAAPGARRPADRRQRRLGLGLQLDTYRRPGNRRSFGGRRPQSTGGLTARRATVTTA
jgi:glycerol uptake facilitator-like aquaporin